MNDTPPIPNPSAEDGPSSAAPVSAPRQVPEGVTGALVLADGSVFWGKGLGASGRAVGEVCFNTSMTGYQEICTDPSYAGEIITFTFPHIGNVGTNAEDIETLSPAVRGVVLRDDITEPSSWRNAQHFDAWLKSHNLIGLAGVDSRAITRRIRDAGAPHGTIVHFPEGPDGPGEADIEACRKMAAEWPGLEGMDLAAEVSCRQTYDWSETCWELGRGYGSQAAPKYKVVAVDYGAKRNILRCLATLGCDVTVVPANATPEEILRHKPDGVFLSNGPGDPAATGVYAVPTVQAVLATGLPLFGICLGHQILALALGAKTTKMQRGHRGANHPVKDLATGKVEITSQNHGFMVDTQTLPAGVVESHVSLFDGTNEGIAVEGRPVFSVQYHPEASPGPTDSHYLFKRFVALIEDHKVSAKQHA
ncbi:glutamine-hydrolyzing carbamoyl-phosphate synthase small subunit [Pelagibius sp. CAU 1746]|uniref:glutamine-hydrolyzing carbamoyl-phosphate synthase small subunit n=1 Tax=Pelagibius sp. CAU 1746 TaxID=3140370 RepID=UPI00325B484F